MARIARQDDYRKIFHVSTHQRFRVGWRPSDGSRAAAAPFHPTNRRAAAFLQRSWQPRQLLMVRERHIAVFGSEARRWLGARGLSSRPMIRVEGLMVRSAFTSLVCLAALMSGCAATASRRSAPEGTSPAATFSCSRHTSIATLFNRAPSPPRFSVGEKVPKADEGALRRDDIRACAAS